MTSGPVRVQRSQHRQDSAGQDTSHQGMPVHLLLLALSFGNRTPTTVSSWCKRKAKDVFTGTQA